MAIKNYECINADCLFSFLTRLKLGLRLTTGNHGLSELPMVHSTFNVYNDVTRVRRIKDIINDLLSTTSYRLVKLMLLIRFCLVA